MEIVRLKPCNDWMELCDEIKRKAWNSGKKKLDHMDEKNKNYVMLILHQIKLMTSNGFGILLILVERIKRDISQT